MNSLADVSTHARLRARIEKLTPNAQRQWGKMTVHQMVCHLNDAFRMADGSRASNNVDNAVSRTLIRFVALHTPMKWPPGAKTMPEVDQQQGGTPPVEWDADLQDLLRRYDAFKAPDGHRHPFFGMLSKDEWNTWAFRHIDHHLRQFGV